METPKSRDGTQLLISLGTADQRALDEMLPLVYQELRRLARHYVSKERPGHMLQPTALVHEVYLRLIDQRRVDWTNRAQFLGLAATMMRRILVNHARDRAAAKRGGDARKVSLSLAVEPAGPPGVDVMALHSALDRLSAIDLRKSRVVELKFFGGLTTEEIGRVLEVSPATVEREWSSARAWLYDEVEGGSVSQTGARVPRRFSSPI